MRVANANEKPFARRKFCCALTRNECAAVTFRRVFNVVDSAKLSFGNAKLYVMETTTTTQRHGEYNYRDGGDVGGLLTANIILTNPASSCKRAYKHVFEIVLAMVLHIVRERAFHMRVHKWRDNKLYTVRVYTFQPLAHTFHINKICMRLLERGRKRPSRRRVVRKRVGTFRCDRCDGYDKEKMP